jgi:hypothetical protein
MINRRRIRAGDFVLQGSGLAVHSHPVDVEQNSSSESLIYRVDAFAPWVRVRVLVPQFFHALQMHRQVSGTPRRVTCGVRRRSQHRLDLDQLIANMGQLNNVHTYLPVVNVPLLIIANNREKASFFVFLSAEREGFEPSIRILSRIAD